MTPKRLNEINGERLTRWCRLLNAHHATPCILIGVGHDAHAGEVHCIAVEDMSDDELLRFLLFAIEHIQKKGGAG